MGCHTNSLNAGYRKLRPNPSLERTSTGGAGPRTGQCHHPFRGPSANPVVSAQLKRYVQRSVYLNPIGYWLIKVFKYIWRKLE